MIKVSINGTPANFPTKWEEVTYGQYLKILVSKSKAELIAILLNQDFEELKNKTVTGLESLFDVISFTDQVPKFETSYPKIGPYRLERNNDLNENFDIRFESLGQFEDMRSAMIKVKSDEPLSLMLTYGKSVAIYLQKIRDKAYDNTKVPELEDEIKGYPACEVMGLGQFFFLKLMRLSNGTPKTSPPTVPSPKKSRRALKSSKRRSGSTRR